MSINYLILNFQYGHSNGPLSPAQSETSHWSSSNYESLSGSVHDNNNTKTSLKGGSKNLSFRNLAPRPYKPPQVRKGLLLFNLEYHLCHKCEMYDIGIKLMLQE